KQPTKRVRVDLITPVGVKNQFWLSQLEMCRKLRRLRVHWVWMRREKPVTLLISNVASTPSEIPNADTTTDPLPPVSTELHASTRAFQLLLYRAADFRR